MTLTTEEQQALEREGHIRDLAPEMLELLRIVARHEYLMENELGMLIAWRIRRVLREANRA